MSSTLPAGSITFLFTDIEGSTQLWEKYPEAMKDALAKHDSLLRSIFESHNGHVFKTIGDAFCVAFASPSDALVASLEAQRALQTESWGKTPIKVRMALHTGEAEARDNDYFGTTVNRVARIMSAGHGGQILLSQDTEAQLQNNLPQAVTLKEIGKHRMKGLTQLEQVYQVVAADLPSDFPRLNTLDISLNNLPLELTSFVGRENEIAQVKQLLTHTRLLTLTGAGGCGKTRLSLEVASQLQADYPDGVWFVELAPLADPSLVLPSVAGVLGVREQQGYALRDLLTEYLRQKKTLLILDNTEHLVEACAEFASDILRAALHLHLMVTSREALGIGGEQIFYVPSLQLPDVRETITVETIAPMESVRLFVERVTAVQPGFSLTSANASAVAQICRRLDGIPLAIELAAARVQALSVEQIAKRLDDRFRLLTGGSRTALPRQQTLRTLIDWSYNLLTEPERILLRRLSVFAGGWTLEASEAVCAGDGIAKDDVCDLVMYLVARSLILPESQDGEMRYRFLETIRQYARDRLLDTDEGTSVRDRHLDYYLQLVQETETKLHGSEELATLDRLDIEHDNFRAALEWALGEGRVERGLQLAGALTWYWDVRAYWREGLERATSLLAQPEAAAMNLSRANGLLVAGVMTDRGRLGDVQTSRQYFEELIAIAGKNGDAGKPFLALGLLNLGDSMFGDDPALGKSMLEEGLTIAQTLGQQWLVVMFLECRGKCFLGMRDFDASRKSLEECLTLCQQIGDKRQMALVLRGIANISFYQRHYASIRQLYEQSLNLLQEVKDRAVFAVTLTMLAEFEFIDGKYDLSKRYTLECVEIQRELGMKLIPIGSYVRLGYIALHYGEFASARSYFSEGLAAAREIGSKAGIAYGVGTFASMMAVEKQAGRAIPLFAFFHTFFELGDKRSFTPMDEMIYEKYLAIAREQVDEATFNAAWAEGQKMTLEQAIEYALSDDK